ncbi:hypothetical protein AGMMS49965_19820 [Bacteroidia bacterium]|nr:hypothetical protein AGMMS49965_19820 [Bacteroidia bacterium]
MKKIFFNVTACICAGLLFAGCNKGSGGSGFDGVIQATAVSLPPGLTADEVDIDEVKVVVHRENGKDEDIASGVYDKGRFILNLPLIVQDKYLSPITDGLSGGVKVSDVDAKLCGRDEILAYKGENQVGELCYVKEVYYNNEDDPFAEYEGMVFWYVDRDVNITGSYSEIGGDDNNITESIKYNLSLKKGWNKVYYKQSGDKANNTVSAEITSTELSGLTWYYRPY